jgi:arylsulfatase A-like enzyme
MRRNQLLLAVFIVFISCKNNTDLTDTIIEKPNIIIIYADDLGYGDVSSYGSTELLTPNFDRIANEGIRFTNGYATSPTCTPSRYALLSGRYPFRSRRARVLQGNAPLLFELGHQTLPSMLQDAGYFTGVVGKWHLGLGDENLDWNDKVAPGPREIGFDYSYIMASTNDRVPSVYVENHSVVGLDPNDPIQVSYRENFEGEPTGRENPELLKMMYSHGHDMSIHNGISRIGYQKGGKSALFIDENMTDDFLRESLKFVNDHKEEPFFLFYSLHQPHVPRVPHPRFAGTSGLGARGDVILEGDWAVGQLLDELDRLGLANNTIVVFSSDNGPVLNDGYHDEAVTKIGSHTPRGGLRGGKYSLFDAGTHVPFMLRWPAKVKPGVSDALVCQIDFTSSFAALVGQTNETPDSENILNAFTGRSEIGRTSLLLGKSDKTMYRKGDYVLIPPHGGPKKTNKWVNIETGRDTLMQLYNLKEDRAQRNNIAKENPEIVEELLKEIETIKGKLEVNNNAGGY